MLRLRFADRTHRANGRRATPTTGIPGSPVRARPRCADGPRSAIEIGLPGSMSAMVITRSGSESAAANQNRRVISRSSGFASALTDVDRHCFECHSAYRAVTGRVAHDLRVHRTSPLGAGRRLRNAHRLECHAALGTIPGSDLLDFRIHRAGEDGAGRRGLFPLGRLLAEVLLRIGDELLPTAGCAEAESGALVDIVVRPVWLYGHPADGIAKGRVGDATGLRILASNQLLLIVQRLNLRHGRERDVARRPRSTEPAPRTPSPARPSCRRRTGSPSAP